MWYLVGNISLPIEILHFPPTLSPWMHQYSIGNRLSRFHSVKRPLSDSKRSWPVSGKLICGLWHPLFYASRLVLPDRCQLSVRCPVYRRMWWYQRPPYHSHASRSHSVSHGRTVDDKPRLRSQVRSFRSPQLQARGRFIHSAVVSFTELGWVFGGLPGQMAPAV